MSARTDRDPNTQQKFQSGQVMNGLFEFDSSEVFILEDGQQVQLIGQVPVGAVFRLQRGGHLATSRFQAVGRRKEGQRFILQADRLPSSADCFGFVRYRGPAMLPHENFPKDVDTVLGVEAISRNGNCPQEYFVRIHGKGQWIPSVECVSANDPYMVGNARDN